MSTEAPTICSYNDCKLTAEEIKHPYMHNGDVFCESCDDSWRSENESECPFCCDWFEEDDLSDCFVVVEEVDDMEVGLYAPLRRPFFSVGLVGSSHFYEDAIERVGSLLRPERANTGYPCAFVCKQCMGERGPWWNPITKRWDGEEQGVTDVDN